MAIECMSSFLRRRGHIISKGNTQSFEFWAVVSKWIPQVLHHSSWEKIWVTLPWTGYFSVECRTVSVVFFVFVFFLFFKHPSILLQQRGLCSADFHFTQRKVFEWGCPRAIIGYHSVNIKDSTAFWPVLTNIVTPSHCSMSYFCHIIFCTIIIIFHVCSIFYIIPHPFGMTSLVHSLSW